MSWGGVMGVELKKMAKSIAAAADDDSFGGRLKSWPERVKTFYNDVRTEMRKVTTPSFKDVRATTTVVIITVFLFGLYFWAVDNTIGSGINYLFKYLVHR
jgi:preprotein translocase subunit SecE